MRIEKLVVGWYLSLGAVVPSGGVESGHRCWAKKDQKSHQIGE